MARTERLPSAKDIVVPVSVPSESGNSELVVGKGSLAGGQLVIKFNNKVHAMSIQRLLSRGAILGVQFVMFQPDDRNLAAQVQLEEEASTQADMETIPEEAEEESHE